MIRKVLERIAAHFEDKDWLRDQKRHELLAQRETMHIERRLRLEPPFEHDIFPPIPKHKSGRTCT